MKRFKTLVAISILASASSAWAADDTRGADRNTDRGADRSANPGDRAANQGDRAANPGDRAANPGDRGERAANPGERNGAPAMGRGEGRDGRRTGAADYIANLDKAVGLTDEQKKAITEIFNNRDKALREFEAQNADKIKEASKRLQDAAGGNDRGASEAAVKARAEYRETLAPMHEIMKQADDDLAALLTPEQKTKQLEYRIAMEIKRLTAPVELGDDQMKKLIGIVQSHQGERRGGVAELTAAIDEMLTPEQKETIARGKALSTVMGKLRSVQLTREQQEEVRTIYEDLSKDKTVKADELAGKLTEKITALLTDEQKEALKNGTSRGRNPREDATAPRGGAREGAPADANSPRGAPADANPPRGAREGTRDEKPAAPGGAREGTPAPAGGSRDGAPGAQGGARNAN